MTYFPPMKIETPSETEKSMWDLMERLFPLHRTLISPGFHKSLEMIQEEIPMEITKFPCGSKVFDWVIPNSFHVNEAYVEAEDGSYADMTKMEDGRIHVQTFDPANNELRAFYLEKGDQSVSVRDENGELLAHKTTEDLS